MTARTPAPPIHPCEDLPRVPPLPVDTMRSDWLATLSRIPGDGLKGAGFPRNVLGVLMHNADTFGPFLDFWVTSKLKMNLSVREQEIVILRMACLYSSDYVWKHHVPVGREFGLTDAELQAIRTMEPLETFSAREHMLLRLTNALVINRAITPPLWQACQFVLSRVVVIDLVSLVAQYVFFALVNNAFQVQVEPTLAAIPSLRDD